MSESLDKMTRRHQLAEDTLADIVGEHPYGQMILMEMQNRHRLEEVKAACTATDPKYYLDEPTLAVEMFPCRACGVPAGSPCVQETHAGRVDKLRSLRAYVKGMV